MLFRSDGEDGDRYDEEKENKGKIKNRRDPTRGKRTNCNRNMLKKVMTTTRTMLRSTGLKTTTMMTTMKRKMMEES